MYVRIGAKIKKAREGKFLSQAELGAKIGMTATAINYYEKGKRKISIDDLCRVAAVLGKPLEYFLSEGDTPGEGGEKLPRRKPAVTHDLVDIPVLGAVPAGEPVTEEQNLIGRLPFPREQAGEVHFALQVKGDSMVGEGICAGDLVLIRRQSWVDFSGQIVCALVNGENTLKIFIKDAEGKIRLRAANPVYPDIVLDSESDLVIQGVYAGVFKFPTYQPQPGTSRPYTP